MDILDSVFYKSKLLIEQHFHGCYGINFSTCKSEDILFLARKLLKHGIGGFFPTLVTDSVENIKRQIKQIKIAQQTQTSEMAEILGIHLEGIFINPKKKGIHNKELLLEPTIKNYQLIEDNLIKIVTLAPELDKNYELSDYLTKKGIKVQAGHCIGSHLEKCSGVTHLFNAMGKIDHRINSTSLSALINDNIYTEIIADNVHLSKNILKLIFKAKPKGKIILISDSLPITKSKLKEIDFAGKQIFYQNGKATSKDGTIAGSTTMLDEIISNLSSNDTKNFENYVKMGSDNLYEYHHLEIDGCIYWDEYFNIVAIEKSGNVLYKNS